MGSTGSTKRRFILFHSDYFLATCTRIYNFLHIFLRPDITFACKLFIFTFAPPCISFSRLALYIPVTTFTTYYVLLVTNQFDLANFILVCRLVLFLLRKLSLRYRLDLPVFAFATLLTPDFDRDR